MYKELEIKENMIRKLAHEDLDRVLEIWLAASLQAHGFLPKEYWESKLEDMRKIYIPSSETCVFDEEGFVKGFISIRKEKVEALFVDPLFQNRGIGKNLIEYVKQNKRELSLCVYKKNRNGIRFYKKNGFKITYEEIDKETMEKEYVMRYKSVS